MQNGPAHSFDVLEARKKGYSFGFRALAAVKPLLARPAPCLAALKLCPCVGGHVPLWPAVPQGLDRCTWALV